MRILALLALAFAVTAAIPACGGAASTPAAPKAAKYNSNLAAAVAALAENDAVKAERAAFALTLLDTNRCEGHAALGASLALQKKQSESKAEFDLAKSNAGGSGQRLVELLAYSTAAAPMSVEPAGSQGAAGEKWQSTLADAIAALFAGDAVKAERLAYAVTQLDDSRCEVDAVLAIALSKQFKQSEAKAAFDAAKAKARGSDVGMMELLLAVVSRSVVAPAPTPTPKPAPVSVLAPEPAPQPAPVSVPTPVPVPVLVPVPTPQKPADSKRILDWCEVLAAAPDPAVVTDAEARARMTATKLPWKVRDRKTGIVMLLCPPGEFMMGSPDSEVGHSNDETQHRVPITKAFYLSETEVTQEVWQTVIGANPSRYTGAGNPVERVSWHDCQKFCQSSGLRFASESEWEYACRAGTTTAYSFGASITQQQANFDSTKGTVACGSLPANQWGFREMHGNVWEWCEDGYQTTASGTQDAVDGNSLSNRVLRGGSWYYGPAGVRSSDRGHVTPGTAGNIIGFRVARAPL